jgi:GntR family transcriptional regulator
LRDLVASSRVGDRLPSERQLSARWGAARMTIRRATDALIEEGLVERRHGSGTYVVPQPFARLLGLTSFSQDMRQRGLTPGSRLLEFGVIAADASLASQLRVAPGARVLRFTRLRLADGEPMALETIWIPAGLVPSLEPHDLEGSLYELLADRYGIAPGSASVTIEPVLLDEDTRRLLGVAANQACLRIAMLDRDARGRAIMAADCVYRGDRYKLTAELSGSAFTGSRTRRPA